MPKVSVRVLLRALPAQRNRLRRAPLGRMLIADDGGFSTLGIVLSLTISLSLLFSAAQVYRISQACMGAQNVADASALAAENQVSSFYTAAQVCDAAVLSLSVTGVVALGVGTVALCVPFTQSLGSALVDASVDIFRARDSFAHKAASGLNTVQRLLPFFAAAQAAGVAWANGDGDVDRWTGFAVLVPFEGKEIKVGGLEGALDAAQDAAKEKDKIAQAAKKAEDALRECDAHKLRAFMADCGSAPGYCMQERAAKLAGMQGARNPVYRSVDAWSFSVALNRAKTYYPARLAQEKPTGGSVEEAADSACRMRFYAFACDEIAKGYVYEDADGTFDALFPTLPANTSQMRATRLYLEAAYPITQDEQGRLLMHAWEGCPGAAAGICGTGSIEQMETDDAFVTCDACRFTAASVGKVAAASTSIENGFEHHYAIVAQQAQLYCAARAKATQAAADAKQPASSILDQVARLGKAAANARISVEPPGRVGAVSIVFDIHGVPVAEMVPNGFVGMAKTLGPRVAISAATLAQDEADGENSVISSLLDGVIDSAGWGSGEGSPLVLTIWSKMLDAYGSGQQFIEDAVAGVLDSIPVLGSSGLGSWASGKLHDAIDDWGFAPAKLSALKPVVVNSYHVSSVDDGAFAKGLSAAKQGYAHAHGSGVGNPLSVVAGAIGWKVDSAIEGWDGKVVIGEISLFGEGFPSIPISVTLPASVKDKGVQAVDGVVEAFQSIVGAQDPHKRWE